MEQYLRNIIHDLSSIELDTQGRQVIVGYDSGRPIVFSEHGEGQLLRSILEKDITYCAGTNKLDVLVWAINHVKRRQLEGLFLEAGVAMGGSAIVSAKLKSPETQLRLYDVFDLLPPPGKEDEEHAHAVYQKFASGVGTGQETDSKYLKSVDLGLLSTVIHNLNMFGIIPSRDQVELIKGDFQETLFIDEGIAFAHIDCDWYGSVKCCIQRIADKVVEGGIIVFDDYNSFSGAKRAIDEWLCEDNRFKVIDSRWSLVVVRQEEKQSEGLYQIIVAEPQTTPVSKPKILLLVDRPGWAYDSAALAVASGLRNKFEFAIRYIVDAPVLDELDFDLIYVFFWGESYHCNFVSNPQKVIKEISSHRWGNEQQYGLLKPEQVAQRFLMDAGTLTSTSRRLQTLFSPTREILFTPNGVDTDTFFDKENRTGPLKIGWAGNIQDPCKGVIDILIPAAGSDFTLTIAGGDRSRGEMCEFYNSIDVLCIASTAEGEPLTLLEGMACGCFPICVDVGIVPEVIQHRKNGLVVDRTVSAFRAAFQWCMWNVDEVRSAGHRNTSLIALTRSWEMVIPYWRDAFVSALKKKVTAAPDREQDIETKDTTWHNNLGSTLLEWPDRARLAAKVVAGLPHRNLDSVLDLGCGHQTLRRFLPSELTYTPVDLVARTPDTLILDINHELPEGKFSIATMLGVLEYLDDIDRVLEWLAGSVRYLVFSFNDCSDEDKRRKQHWKSVLGFRQIESKVARAGGTVLLVEELGGTERVYAVAFDREGCVRSRPAQTSRLALFSAAVNGDNCGDALIVDAISRMLDTYEMHTFPLLNPLSPEQLERVNSCDMSIICGTNLYQTTFACALDPEVLSRIKIPIIPIGLGTSSPIGTMPRMDASGIRTVRMLHERCAVSSVRDPASLAFVKNLGIRNVELTGCPVLFHSGQEPDFSYSRGDGLYIAVRARLLHVDAGLETKEKQTLNHLIREFKPVLVLQSPYDIPMAQGLIEEYGLQYLLDTDYTEKPLLIGVRNASRTAGFRLHFGMLSLSYGKHTTLIGSDTRVSEFCNMMGLSYHDIHSYTDEALIQELKSAPPSMTSFVSAWRDLRSSMATVLKANGLSNTLAV